MASPSGNLAGTSDTSLSFQSITKFNTYLYFHSSFYLSPFYKYQLISGLLQWPPNWFPCICSSLVPVLIFTLQPTTFLKPLSSCPLVLGYRQKHLHGMRGSHMVFPLLNTLALSQSLVPCILGVPAFLQFLIISKLPPTTGPLHMFVLPFST